jgi:hypothetical protein
MLGVMPPEDPWARLAWEVERVSDRLRSLSLARLGTALPPHASRADAGHALAQWLADAAADLDGRPRWPVPRLGDQTVGDQVAVTGYDLGQAARRAGAGADGVTLAAIAELRDLRLRL